MTPKERVNAALRRDPAGRLPDTVPIGEFAIDYPAFEAILGRPSFWRGHAKTTMALWEGRRDEVVETQIADAIEFFHKTDQDIITVHQVPSRNARVEPWTKIDSERFRDPKGDVYRISPKSEWLWCMERANPWPEYSLNDFPVQTEFAEPDDSCWELVRAIVKEFGRTHYIVGRSGDGTFPLLGGMERGLVLLHEQPEIPRRVAENQTRHAIFSDKLWKREGVDALFPGTDYADNRGPLVSPRVIRELFYPLMKEHCDAAHAIGMPVFKHACGNNWAIMDMFVGAGYDVYQSIQESATMDLGRLKREVGDSMALMGGVNTHTLCDGTPDDVRAEVRRAIEVAAPGGGFILASSHSILVGAKPENYLAMLDEGRKAGNL